MKVLSYGGGLDSFAMLVDAIERGEHPDVVAFVDVADPEGKDPGEWPGTYRHIREVVIPLCRRYRIEFVWIDSRAYPVRGARSLWAWMWERGQIPVAGPNRICTRIAKVERFEAWLTDRFPGQDVEVWIGFEAGEEERAEKDPNAGGRTKPKPGAARRRNRFPLMERGLCRCRAEQLVRRLGYPVPRKSACVYCPYGKKRDWKTLARELPEVFAQVVALEDRKPPTSNGAKLSIMAFRTVTSADGTRHFRPTPLPVYVERPYRPKREPCGVCGAPEKATKATGCDWLEAA